MESRRGTHGWWSPSSVDRLRALIAPGEWMAVLANVRGMESTASLEAIMRADGVPPERIAELAADAKRPRE